MTVRKTLLCIALGLGALTTTSAFAAPTTILDTYIGDNDTSTFFNNTQDASSDRYNIESMTANITPTAFSVSIKAKEYHDIFTAGAGNNDSYFQSWVKGNILSAYSPGDLFISTNGWHPYATSGSGNGAPAYGLDNKVNGEQWEYAASATDFTHTVSCGFFCSQYVTSGATKLMLTPGSNNSDWNIVSGSVRYGQVAEIDDYYVSQHSGLAGTWSITDSNGNGVLDTLTYNFVNTSSVLNLTSGQQLGLSWTMLCANDVIQGGVAAVPEPETYAMLLAGLGLVGYRVRRRMRTL
jgi:hypothetical protein